MAYDERLAQRACELLADKHPVVEKRMFGGIAFMLRGNMCCGVVGNDLVVRVGPEQYERALARPHARPMDFTGRPLRGMVYVAPGGYRANNDLKWWVEQGLKFVDSLPTKES